MKKNTVLMKFPKGDGTIEVVRDMVEYFEKMGYTLVNKSDNPKVIKLTPKKDKE